jgi:hypothetical protein
MFRLVGLIFIFFFLALPAQAQGDLIFRDEAGVLNRSRVADAAQPLIDRGARVAVYTVDSGDESDFQRQLEQDDLVRGGSVDTSMIAMYVSFDPRFSSIRFGDRWNEALDTNNNFENIRNSELNPGLAAGDPTGGFVNALSAIDRAIASPPQAGGGTTVEIDPTPVVVGGGALALLGIGGPLAYRAARRRRKAAAALANARQSAEEGRRNAGAAIADLGQLFNDAREKAQYDKLSYPPADVEQLAQTQRAAETLFVQAQEQFDNVGEALKAKQTPTETDFKNTAGAYQQVVELAGQSRAQLDQVQARRSELDKLNAAAPGEIDRAKKALADAAERLNAIRADFANPDAVTRPTANEIARAESLLAEHRAADAIAAAQAASATTDELIQRLARYIDMREGISVGRSGAEKAAAQGYRIEAGMQAFSRAEDTLRQVAKALERGDLPSAGAFLDQAEAARAEGVARGGGMPALRQNNAERIPAVEQSGQQLDTYIAEGRRTFDIVDEFAESAWSDIRGNGSEAEEAAQRSRALWERAVSRNAMETQDFLGAQQDLHAAEVEIANARALIDAIIQRLKDLEAARDVARQEISAAQADIEKGWTFVRSRDADVGKDPEERLTRANALINEALSESQQQRPNWLTIVKRAREANQLADEALAAARSEAEAMDKLREQVGRAQQLATAEVKKLIQFAGTHARDIPRENEAHISRLQEDVQAAYAARQAAEQAVEGARATAFRAALEYYTQLEERAEEIYNQVYTAFQRLEEMRRRVDSEVDRARNAINRAESTLQSYSPYIRRGSDGVRLLEEAQRLLASISQIYNDEDMRRALETANGARSAAERAERDFRRDISMRQQTYRRDDDDLGEFIAGAVIGSILSGSGGGGGGGGGRSHRSWGGGGGGGGSWGGGGGGGGSWGGGGGGGGGGGW